MRFAHDVRMQEYIFFLERLIKREDDRVPFAGCGVVGCGLWVMGYGLWVMGRGPRTLRFYDFSLQILFQEIEIGHL